MFTGEVNTPIMHTVYENATFLVWEIGLVCGAGIVFESKPDFVDIRLTPQLDVQKRSANEGWNRRCEVRYQKALVVKTRKCSPRVNEVVNCKPTDYRPAVAAF